jgi:hypothetical protein
MIPIFRAAGIELYQTKRRDFSSLLEFIRECEKEKIGAAIADSLTHVWRDLTDSYDKKLKRNGRLQFQDWARIKGEWRQYTDLFVNSNLHLIVCGRAGYEYDYDVNADGTKDLIKTGTKMKAEAEFGFEPSLVIEMERLTHEKDDVAKGKKKITAKVGSEWIHRAHILKDRADVINGKSFDAPEFKHFEPHFLALNIGGEHFGVDTEKTSENRFDESGNGDWARRQKEKTICLEEIQGTMTKIWPGQSADEKKCKADFVDAVFGTRSWTKVEASDLSILKRAQGLLREFEAQYSPGKAIASVWSEISSMPEPVDDLPN